MNPGSGLIFAIITVGWLAYLTLILVARRNESALADASEETFADSMTLVRGGAPDAVNPDLQVSTPLTRNAARHAVVQTHRIAARRRRRVVLVLLVATVATVVASALGHLAWWVGLIPGTLFLAFLGLSRWSTVTLNRDLDARLKRIDAGWDEDTIVFEVPADLRDDIDDEAAEHSIEISAPITPTGSLWDPIPVTAPTYVSKPMAPRTIRTIDLSMPALVTPDPTPVTAEPTLSVENTAELPPAVGE